MRLLFTFVLLAHGLIHLMGVVKAFGVAQLPQLTLPVSRPLGILWLIAALLFLATVAALFVWPRWWWVVGALAILTSQAAISTAWADAKFGTIANAIALAGVVAGFLSQGPWSVRTEFDRRIELGFGRGGAAQPVTDADLVRLPVPVQRYLRQSGVVGQPRVRNLRVHMKGRIRSGPDARWMPFTAEQANFYDELSRFFLMDASMLGIPFQAYHRYQGPSATMRVTILSLVPIVESRGSLMDQAETVTIFNDMCVLAPATLVDPGIRWEEVDATTSRAWFTNAGHTISATLSFSASGELLDFLSDDRLQVSSGGATFTRTRWSTPLRDYRDFGRVRLAARGEGRWHEAAGEYAYIEVEIVSVEYNVSRS